MAEGTIVEVALGDWKFMVWFYEEPDLGMLDQPVDGPEHNYKLAQLLRLLKGKIPESMEDEISRSEDPAYCRREWLAELQEIEDRLGGELRGQLEADAGEYL